MPHAASSLVGDDDLSEVPVQREKIATPGVARRNRVEHLCHGECSPCIRPAPITRRRAGSVPAPPLVVQPDLRVPQSLAEAAELGQHVVVVGLVAQARPRLGHQRCDHEQCIHPDPTTLGRTVMGDQAIRRPVDVFAKEPGRFEGLVGETGIAAVPVVFEDRVGDGPDVVDGVTAAVDPDAPVRVPAFQRRPHLLEVGRVTGVFVQEQQRPQCHPLGVTPMIDHVRQVSRAVDGLVIAASHVSGSHDAGLHLRIRRRGQVLDPGLASRQREKQDESGDYDLPVGASHWHAPVPWGRW